MKSIVYEVIWGNELENTSKQQQQQQEHDSENEE
jgi:hypothetical protein